MPIAANETFRRSAEARVAFFGCRVGEGGLVRVGLVDGEGSPPKGAIDLTCPRCGDPHRVKLSGWRRPTPADEGREPDILVDRVVATVGESANDDEE
jgi:hypothetical protein